MLVLGLHFEHDAGATLMKDGKILLCVEAERITGVKHDAGIGPAGVALRACLDQAGVTGLQIDAIAFSDVYGDDELPWFKFDRRPEIQEATHKGRLAAQLGTMSGLEFDRIIPPSVSTFRPDIPVFLTCHSVSHAASAIYMSGKPRAAGLVIDGYGTCCGMMGYVYREGALQQIEKYRDRFLLGAGYHHVGVIAKEILATHYMDAAGKVMGLNAYGKPNSEWVNYLTQKYFVSSAETGYSDYEGYKSGTNQQRICEDLFEGGVTAGSLSVDDAVYRNLVASMQMAFTYVVRACVQELIVDTGESDIFLSGGCALNIIANSAVAESPSVASLFIPPNPSDSGQSMGNAILAMHAMTGKELHSPN